MAISSIRIDTGTNDNEGYEPCRGSVMVAAKNRQIAKATELVQHHVQSMVLLLNERAAAYALAVRFDLALRDAELMQVLVPSSALGYLQAGGVYAQQGKQRLAIKAYNKGLQAVIPSNPGYKQLKDHRAVAQAHWNTKLDMICALPLDVVTTYIFPRILLDRSSSFHWYPRSYGSDMLYRCLRVSKAWFNCILKYMTMCFSVVNGHSVPILFWLTNSWQSPQICSAPSIASLRIKPCKAVRWARRQRLSITDNGKSGVLYYADSIPVLMLLFARFDSLTDLSIDDEISKSSFFTVLTLRRLGETLTHLDIHCKNSRLRSPLRLGDIMSACPNLASLTAGNADPDMSTCPEEYPKLKHLALPTPACLISSDKLMSIISRVPMIESLKLYGCLGSQGLAMMHRYCPSLKTLHYNISNDDAFGALRDKQPKEERTLHEFRVSGSWSTSCDGSYAADDVIQLLTGYASTLEAFYYHGGLVCSNSSSIELQFPQFCRLRHVAFCVGNDDTMQFPIQMLRHAPQLASVSLEDRIVSHATIDALAELGGLTSLWTDKVDSGVDDSILCQLLERVYRLRNVGITAVYDASERPAWLESLASMPQIRMLDLELGPFRSRGSRYPADLFEGFIGALVQHRPDIEHLELVCTTASLSTPMFAPLVSLTRLKYLVIKAYRFDNDTLLQLRKCSSLVRLEICTSHRTSPSNHLLKRLRNKISEVTYASID